MNEKKLKEIIHMGNDNRCNTCYQDGYEDGRKDGRKEGFQKGKLQEREDSYLYLLNCWDGYDETANMIINDFKKRIKQLQKEIGGDENDY